MKTILLIDDELLMLDLLSLYLSPIGFKCVKMSSAIDGLSYLENNEVDLILLDLMMPEMDGWEACKEIRKLKDVPIIMLTARSEKQDVVKGLKIGADDYICKPFDEDELVARIEAVLRRKRNNKERINFHGLLLDVDSYELEYNGQTIPLTPKEFSLIGLFLQHRNKVFTRDHLITTIWGHGVSTEDRTIDSHVRNLRDKLRKAGFHVDDFLATVWGIGYKWNDKEEV